jgi:hypothetical protein
MDKCLREGCRNINTVCIDCGRTLVTRILPTSMEWINISDQLPPKESQLLAWNGHYIDVVYYDGIKTQTLDAGDWNDAQITHWMPLPNPPISDKEQWEKMKAQRE